MQGSCAECLSLGTQVSGRESAWELVFPPCGAGWFRVLYPRLARWALFLGLFAAGSRGGGVELGLDHALERASCLLRHRNAVAAPRSAPGHATGSRRWNAAWSGAKREASHPRICCAVSVFGIAIFGCRNAGARVNGFAVERGRRAIVCLTVPGAGALRPSGADPVRLIPAVCALGLVVSTAGPVRSCSVEPDGGVRKGGAA